MGESYYDDADERRYQRGQAEAARRAALAARGYLFAGGGNPLHHAPCGVAVYNPDTHDKFCPALQVADGD